MIIVIYQIYLLNNRFSKIEGFADVPAQSLGGVDDTNAINTLAQIAKNLMAGGVTVPGAMTVNGALNVISPSQWGNTISLTGGTEAPYINFINRADGKRNGYIMGAPDKFVLANNVEVGGNLNANGNLTIGGNGSIATGDAPGQAKGTIISNMGDSWGMLWGSECALIGKKGKPMRFGFADAYNAAGWDEKMRIQPDGSLIVQGRNILAELDQCIKNSTVIYNQRTEDGKFVWGDGVGSTDSNWSRWIIRKA